MRTHSATFTARCVIGDAKKSCALLGFALISRELINGRAVFLLLTRSQFLRTARIWLMKSGGEKRPSRFSFIRYAHNSSALLGIMRSCLNSLNHIKSKMYFWKNDFNN